MSTEPTWEVVQEESPDTVVFDTPGTDEITGRYEGPEIVNMEDGDSFKRYLIRTPEGRLLALNASYRLEQGMEKVSPGDTVRVEYVKNIDTGQPSPMKDFRVSVAR